MIKKLFKWGVFLAVLAAIGLGIYKFVIVPDKNLRPIYLIPKDAVYIIETEEPIENWSKISNSEIWQHLQKNNYFAELTANANSLDTLIQNNKKLFSLLGSRSVLVSAHMYKKNDYDFLFVVDLQKISKLSQLRDYLKTVLSNDFKVSKRAYHDNEIIELYDKTSRETLHMAFVENLLVASYTHLLVEASIDQVAEPSIGRDLQFLEVKRKVDDDGLFRLYFQYNFLDEFMLSYMSASNDYIKKISNDLVFSGFNFELDKNMMLADGFTNLNENTASYLKVLQQSGEGEITIPKIAPQRTAFYLSMGFDSFSEFYENFEKMREEKPEQFADYGKNYDKIEKFLKINIRENFIDWVDDEIAFLQMQPSGLGKKNEFAIVLKTKDGDDALENLNFIIKRIKKKTPVKFKQVTYKGYPINFMSIKGFFKLILGDFFAGLDKPYFTIIDDYVIFSNHPQTLKNIINDHNAEKTLSEMKDFKKFINNFDDESSLFVYINTPLLHSNLKSFADKETVSDMNKNKDYIVCFPQIGFQLMPTSDLFESKIAIQFQDPKAVKQKEQFGNDALLVGPQPAENPLISNEMLLEQVVEEELITIDEIMPEDLSAKKYTEEYDDGTLKVEVSLKNGMKHGTYRAYHPNGNIKLKGRYKKDKQVGVWKAYDEEGNRTERKRY